MDGDDKNNNDDAFKFKSSNPCANHNGSTFKISSRQ